MTPRPGRRPSNEPIERGRLEKCTGITTKRRDRRQVFLIPGSRPRRSLPAGASDLASAVAVVRKQRESIRETISRRTRNRLRRRSNCLANSRSRRRELGWSWEPSCKPAPGPPSPLHAEPEPCTARPSRPPLACTWSLAAGKCGFAERIPCSRPDASAAPGCTRRRCGQHVRLSTRQSHTCSFATRVSWR